MYQFWAAKRLTLGDQTTTIFQRIAKMIRDVLGIWSNEARALHILEYFHQGDFAKDSAKPFGADIVGQKLMAEGRNGALEAVKRMSQPFREMGEALIAQQSEATAAIAARQGEVSVVQILLNIVPRGGMAYINGDEPNCLDVASQAPCPVTSVGFGEHCTLRISDLNYETDRSSFTLGGISYSTRMTGEFNVRNAAMAVAAATFAGLSVAEIRDGLETFEGVARRQELRGEVNGIKVIDDFAHHPTAIRLAVQSLRQRHPDSRLWILFEPRSNTTRRAVFQNELAESLALADFAIVAGIPDLHKIPANDRLDPDKLSTDIARLGCKGWYLPDVETIIAKVKADAQPGDIIAVLSNGGFGGIHGKLLESLAF
jgi:UDP-N-acetylmuramate-alanine ligase